MMAEWEICCDGYYPYCSNCAFEPSWEQAKEGLPYVCPRCGALMNKDKTDFLNNKSEATK